MDNLNHFFTVHKMSKSVLDTLHTFYRSGSRSRDWAPFLQRDVPKDQQPAYELQESRQTAFYTPHRLGKP